MLENLNFLFSVLNKLKLFSTNIISGIGSYRNTVFANEWEALAKVYYSKQIENEPLYRGLLFNRCILEYRYLDEHGNSKVWYDIHPLIKGIKEFQDIYNFLYPSEDK